MKVLVCVAAVFAASAVTPADSQQTDWSGTPINSGQQTTYMPTCRQGAIILHNGPCSITDKVGGAINGPPVANTQSITSLPGGADLANIGVLVQTYSPAIQADGSYSAVSGYVSLGQFTPKAQFDSLSASVTAMRAAQQNAILQVQQAQDEARRGIAMASSLNLAAPTIGTNRLAFGLGTFAGANAVSINYNRRSGAFDFGVSAAFAKGGSLGKAGAGFSW